MVPVTMAKMANQFAKVKRGPLLNCLTCTLCLNLLREATTITVCLHTFCKDCIYQKLEEDETCTCPICNVYLGCSPCDKLRPDNNLQELRMKIFPLNKKKEQETSPTVTTTTRRKERSLSSLVTSTNPIPKKRCLGRTRTLSRKTAMSRPNKLHSDRDAGDGSNHTDQRESPEHSNAFSIGTKKQRVLAEKEPCQVSSSHQGASSKDIEEGSSWDRLAFLAEAADKTDGAKLALLGLPAVNKEDYEKLTVKNKRRFRRRARESFSSESKMKIECHNSSGEDLRPDSNGDVEGESSRQLSLPLKSGNRSSEINFRKLYPVWFTLLATKDRNGDSLPQILNSHIRVKDGTMPLSYVNKYLAHKLNLDESEVVVTCCGQSLVSTAPLSSVGDIWVQHMVKKGKGKGSRSPNPKLDPPNSDNIHNFVIVLTYGRRR
ncbi:E3 ubiquitin protein ligase DRIP2-like [Aristolochia californica]|uniref:E3 ubiquitin protein ligase DRIP2-like n=1 Tax=Aristolochia californica TaxID=171875 RepID=UPI0035DEB601